MLCTQKNTCSSRRDDKNDTTTNSDDDDVHSVFFFFANFCVVGRPTTRGCFKVDEKIPSHSREKMSSHQSDDFVVSSSSSSSSLETQRCGRGEYDGLRIVGSVVGAAVSGVWHQLGGKGRSGRVARCEEGGHFSRRASESGRASGECGGFVPRARRF